MRETESYPFLSGIVLLVSFVVVSGCFITNCPPGGKRSGPTNLQIRQCEQCGPAGMKGRCYGPQICCSPEFGCLMGTTETKSCLQENHHSTLCHNPGDSCGGNDESNQINGQCGTPGICCSTETCTLDTSCQHGLTSDQGLQKTKVGHQEEQQHGIYKPANSGQMYPTPLERLFFRRVKNPLDKSSEIPTSDQILPHLIPLFERTLLNENNNANIILNPEDY